MKLPPQITTVLFDMDGVLIDTATAVESTYAQWAANHGLPSEEVLAIIHGRRTVEVVQWFGIGENPETESDRIEAAIAKRAVPENAIHPTCDLYRALNPDMVAIATSARRNTALTNLQVLRLEPPKVLVTGQDVKSGKPSPDPYLLAAKRLGSDPSECVVIEDAPAGIDAGKAAGCHVVALTTSHTAESLKSADQIVAPEQLQEVFSALLTN